MTSLARLFADNTLLKKNCLTTWCEDSPLDVIVMDFAKAFDKVNHSLLVHKLDYYGIRGETNNWIINFMTGRISELSQLQWRVPVLTRSACDMVSFKAESLACASSWLI